VARYVERNQHDWFSTVWKLAIFVGVVIFAIGVVYPWKGLPYTIVLILVGLWLYIVIVSRTTGYVCAKCGKPFQVPTTVNFFSQSAVGKNPDGTYYSYKNLTCPNCGKMSKARLVKRVGAREARGSGRMLK
jgi:DNA-directed RNA polymerase subunit RPC12/RpoP